jgi:hypothetical protein
LKISVIGSFDILPTNDPALAVPFDLSHSLAVQNVIADFGMAPRVHALYDTNHLIKMLSVFTKVNPSLSEKWLRHCNCVGILMDEIPQNWNLQQTDSVLRLSQDLIDTSLNEVRILTENLNLLNIYSPDLQIAITSEGRAILLDLEGITFLENTAVNRIDAQDMINWLKRYRFAE